MDFVYVSSLPWRALFTFSMLALLSATASATQFEISGPPGSGAFGSETVVLPNGNIVVTDPHYSEDGKASVGAVYLYDGATLALISTLKGGTANDQVGGAAIVILANGNFVVINRLWDNGAVVNAGAVTWCSGATGCRGLASNANSLVGSTPSDQVGDVRTLLNGNYVVVSPSWDNGATANVGAVTFASGTGGATGAINSLDSVLGAAPGGGNMTFGYDSGGHSDAT